MNSKLRLFLIITFSLSWGIAGLWWLFTDEPGINSVSYLMMATAFMFMPMLAALIVQKWIYKSKVKEPFGFSFQINRWWGVAWLLPPLIALLTLGVSLLFPQVQYTPDMAGMFDRFADFLTPEQLEEMKNTEMPVHPLVLTLFQGLIAGITINAIAGFGEELGWRGLMHHSLSSLNFWKASLIIGIVWGIWHAPLIIMGHNYPGYPIAGVFMMIIWCILLSPLFSLIRIKSKSVIAASIFHGTINGTYGMSIIMVSGGGVLITGMTGLAGFLVLIAVNGTICLIWPESRHLSLSALEVEVSSKMKN
jgi:uncharacterized protein